MSLSPGTRLGPYEVVAPLGAGGMGEVYRARDTRLERDVAIKVLPQHLSANPEVRMRFEREARTVSALKHPHICMLHDIGRQGDTDYLVMELVEGETLAARLGRGALSTADVLRLGAQIADALERAHRAGVVHRDLKPGNVMVTKDGAKLMDFGLARGTGLGGAAGSGASLMNSPTMAQPLTAEGTLVGTFQYMAPEQLEGKEADARSDIWALGCVLYEMSTGKRAFDGTSQASLISAIMSSQPAPASQITPLSPAGLDRIITQCLAKDPDERFQNAHDVRLGFDVLRDASGVTSAAVGTVTGRTAAGVPWPAVLLSGLVLGVGLGFGLARWLAPSSDVEPPRVSTLVHSGADQQPAASPDGKTIAFSSARAGRSQIWIKQLVGGDEVALTEGEDYAPRFSPDGSQIVFARTDVQGTSVWRVSVVGGQARRLVEDAVEGAWSPDGTQLAFLRTSDERTQGEVWLADADGSGARRIHAAALALRWLSWSPAGDRLIAVAIPLANTATAYVVVPTNGDSAQAVSPASGLSLTSNPVWLGAGDRICYAIIEALATSVTGQASRIVEHSLRTGKSRDILNLPSTCRDLALLGDGKLLIGVAQQSQSLVLVDHPGGPDVRERWLTRGASSDRQPVFSPDGQRVLFSSSRSGNLDIWEMDTESGALSRVTDHPGQDWDPAYTPDGRSILWSSDRTGVFEIWQAATDGSGARQVSRDGVDAENATMTADGQWIVYLSGQPEQAGVWKMRADGSEATPLVRGVNLPETSPDGVFFAAPAGAGQRTGRALRVYRSSDGSPLPWTIDLVPSVDIAVGRSRWAGPRRLAYTDRDASGFMGISVRDITEATVGPPVRLAGFHPLSPTESFDVTHDGTRVVLSVRSQVLSIALAENLQGVDAPPKREP